MIPSLTNIALPPTINQANLVNTIKLAMISCGFNSIHAEFLNGTENVLVYEWVLDSTRTFGRIFIRIAVTTTLIIRQQLSSGWNSGTNTGINPSTEVSFAALATGTTINFACFNSPELRFVAIAQASALVPLGILAPVNRQPFWNLDNWAYGFIFTTAGMTTLRGVAASVNPYANSDFDLIPVGNSRLTNINLETNQPDIIRGLILFSQSNRGIGASFSNNIACGCFNTQTRFTSAVPPGTNEFYLIIQNAAGGICIRYNAN